MRQLIDALRQSIDRILSTDEYNWKALGACNCGMVIQSVTKLSAKEISAAGIRKHGDWQSISLMYEEDSGFQVDKIIKQMLSIGMTIGDFTYLENLSDPNILSYIGKDIVLERDNPEHVIQYMIAWIWLLEDKTKKDFKYTYPELKEYIEELLYY
jgi:hypothetical protein